MKQLATLCLWLAVAGFAGFQFGINQVVVTTTPPTVAELDKSVVNEPCYELPFTYTKALEQLYNDVTNDKPYPCPEGYSPYMGRYGNQAGCVHNKVYNYMRQMK